MYLVSFGGQYAGSTRTCLFASVRSKRNPIPDEPMSMHSVPLTTRSSRGPLDSEASEDHCRMRAPAPCPRAHAPASARHHNSYIDTSERAHNTQTYRSPTTERCSASSQEHSPVDPIPCAISPDANVTVHQHSTEATASTYEVESVPMRSLPSRLADATHDRSGYIA